MVKAKAKAKKVAVKKSAPRKARKVSLESFKVARESAPFVSFRITDQTVYWSILLIMILVLALWVLQIQVDISEILDNINAAV